MKRKIEKKKKLYVGQNFEFNWAKFYDIEQFFIVANGKILKRLFSHLVTLLILFNLLT